jgi:hypothetical protein
MFTNLPSRVTISCLAFVVSTVSCLEARPAEFFEFARIGKTKATLLVGPIS